MRKITGIIVAVVATFAIGGTAMAAQITGTQGNDNLVGTLRSDTIRGLGGDDTIRLLAGDDTGKGMIGNDTVVGRGGNDLVNGGFGNDELWGGASTFPTFTGVPDVFKCGPGVDTVRDYEWRVDSIVGPFGQEIPVLDIGPIGFSETCEFIRVLYPAHDGGDDN